MTPISPVLGETKLILAGTTTANIDISDKGNAVLITNGSDVTIFVRLGQTGVTASIADCPVGGILTGGQLLIQKGPSITHVAAITAAGSNKPCYITPCQVEPK